VASDFAALSFAAHDPSRLARFWTDLLGWEPSADRDGSVALVPTDGTGYRLRFLPSREPKVGQNRIHLDLTSSSLDEQRETVARVLALGGRHIDVGQAPEDEHVVLADPEGNELCVIEAGNRFLAGCGFIGAINCEGSQEVGYFWSKALGWPLVWDQDQETAIQSPRGGTKITWSGPPVAPRIGPDRLHFDLAARDGEQPAEVDRLLALGATPVDVGQGDVDRVVLADPDGNEFCVIRGGTLRA
jgi:catechol 2,3-dioxygenase-like lactoylglutathione lyase family enzyme